MRYYFVRHKKGKKGNPAEALARQLVGKEFRLVRSNVRFKKSKDLEKRGREMGIITSDDSITEEYLRDLADFNATEIDKNRLASILDYEPGTKAMEIGIYFKREFKK